MLLFTEPSAQVPTAFVSGLNAAFRPAISIGSPSWVPVPWASISWMPAGSMPKRRYTFWISRVCDRSFGAVMPLVLPS